jgi:hypothetical protein
MRLVDIEASIYGRLNYAENPDPLVVNRVRRAINSKQREIVSRRGFERLRRGLVTFSSVANTPWAVLPQAAVKIHLITDRTNNITLQEVSFESIRLSDPGLTLTSSIPNGYAIANLAAAVARDPSNASETFAVSSDAGDGSGTYVTVEGITDDGQYRTASTTLNGLTAVSLNSAITNWITIQKFYLSAEPLGTITLTEDSGLGTVLASIAPQHVTTRYSRIHFDGVPASAITYYADVELHVEDMTAASDEPILPEDFHWLIVEGVLLDEFLKRRDTDLYDRVLAKWRTGISDLRSFVRQTSGAAVESGQRGRSSQLSAAGVMFPAGS